MTRAYWESRDPLGRRRIEMLSRGLYRFGLLGRFITRGPSPRARLSAPILA